MNSTVFVRQVSRVQVPSGGPLRRIAIAVCLGGAAVALFAAGCAPADEGVPGPAGSGGAGQPQGTGGAALSGGAPGSGGSAPLGTGGAVST
ncbi:MAG: hypothetical protein ABUS79_07525 [Pseudomonadota bacterium]